MTAKHFRGDVAHHVQENYMTSIKLSADNPQTARAEREQGSWSRFRMLKNYICCKKRKVLPEKPASSLPEDVPLDSISTSTNPVLDDQQESEECINVDEVMEQLHQTQELVQEKEEEIDKQRTIINGLITALKHQSKCIKELASNSRYINVSGCGNVSIDFDNIKTDKSICFLEKVIDSLCEKCSRLESILKEIKEKVGTMECQQKSEDLQSGNYDTLKKLVAQVDELLTENHPRRRHSSQSSVSSIQGLEENDDLHFWLPGKEFRRLISSQSEQRSKQAELRASQAELRMSQEELRGIVRDQHEQLQSKTNSIESKLDMVLQKVNVDINEKTLEQTHL